MDICQCTPQYWIENEADCAKQLAEQWEKLPLLNANDTQNIPNNSLVRFRGMVQDMYNPQFFYEKLKVVNTNTKESRFLSGKYLDITDCQEHEALHFDSPDNVSGERQTLVVISIPGLNRWVETIETERYKITQHVPAEAHSENKRQLDEDAKESVLPSSSILPSSSTLSTSPELPSEELSTLSLSNKLIESNNLLESNKLLESNNLTESNKPNESNKRQCTETEVPNPPPQQPSVSQEHLLNFPLEGREGKKCHVEVYKDFDKLKLNQVCEFVGFLSMDPRLAVCNGKEEFEDEMEFQTHHPAPSLIPRVHCVDWKNLEHNNPLVKDLEMSAEKMGEVRKELMIVFSQVLLGDELAAEYLLYHLISGVYLRQDLLALGKFTLNISQMPTDRLPEYCEKFYEFLELVVSKSHYLPMTLSNMNTMAFTPKKDYQCERLTSGVLQLSPNTHLLLDETKLTPGKLNEAGVKGLAEISHIIKNQKATYDFQYYKMEYDCDIPFLILSEGKSLLPSDCHVPLKPAEICINKFEDLVQSTRAYLIPDRLDDIRKYLTHARLAKYEISDNVQELVQEEFVKMRQSGQVTPDDLHQLLVLARLVCLSEGKSKLDDVCWRRACELEVGRKGRLTKK